MCKQAVAAGVKKGAAMLKKKIKQLPVAAGSKCLKTFGNALCDKAYKKACGRRLISIPGPIKSAFKQVWGAIKGDVNKLKTCMISAAKGAAKSVVMSMVPKSIGSGLKMLGIGRRRMWSIGGALKGAAMLKKKIKQLPVAAGSKCLKTFGNALCDKAYKKACGRRLISIPGPIKSAFKQVWGAIKGDVNKLKSSMISAAKGAAKAVVMS